MKAKYPANCYGYACPAGQEQENGLKALAQAAPERSSAGYGSFHCISGSTSREEEKEWAAMFFNGGSGGGASKCRWLASYYDFFWMGGLK